ncbi:MAG: cob(I)yrinic acid a,c-diamide adenosyltransferase [Tannerella sp.]|jgi:cob(I)alamin adenosyltransferase|nr:cob(I)yrinic acid a,c-diamide adenosyltransferase [Tannerella sp.]
MKSRIYTGGGDKGTTSLVGGYRAPKNHPRIESYGNIDELNSFIGLLIEEVDETETRELLTFVQEKLFTVGSYLATDPTKTEYKVESHVTEDSIQMIESAIDRIDGGLPKMKSFVLPGGCRSSALAHVCRTVCRRAERSICALNEHETDEDAVLDFINRLSDLLFVMARNECILKKGNEIFWNKTCK